MTEAPHEHDERREGCSDRRKYDERPLRQAAEEAQRRLSLTGLETAILCAVLTVMGAVAALGFYVHSIAQSEHSIAVVQQEGITRGLKNRAVACAGLGGAITTVPACLEPEVLQFYTPDTAAPRAP